MSFQTHTGVERRLQSRTPARADAAGPVKPVCLARGRSWRERTPFRGS